LRHSPPKAQILPQSPIASRRRRDNLMARSQAGLDLRLILRETGPGCDHAGRTSPVCRRSAAKGDAPLPKRVPFSRVHFPSGRRGRPNAGRPLDQTEMGSMPCRPFRLPSSSPVPPGTLGTSARLPCRLLAGSRESRCYLGPAPTLEDFNHLAASPGTGDQPGSSSASRIRIHRQSRDHVAQPGYYGQISVGTCSPPGEPQSPHDECEISGGRSQKHPLTHSTELFAVRHRLLENFLASASTRPVAPFTVELFTFGGLGRYPGPGFGPGPSCHHDRGSLREPG